MRQLIFNLVIFSNTPWIASLLADKQNGLSGQFGQGKKILNIEIQVHLVELVKNFKMARFQFRARQNK